jgi:hypothetical protein
MSISISAALKGLEVLERGLDTIVKKRRVQAEVGTKRGAEAILRRAIRYTPEKWGTLRGSGRIERRGSSKRGFTYVVIFGGPGIPYAIPVHEHPSGASPHSWRQTGTVRFSPSGTGPKFLERATFEEASNLARVIASAMGGQE